MMRGLRDTEVGGRSFLGRGSRKEAKAQEGEGREEASAEYGGFSNTPSGWLPRRVFPTELALNGLHYKKARVAEM